MAWIMAAYGAARLCRAPAPLKSHGVRREGGFGEAQVGVVLGPGIAGFVAPFGMCRPHRFEGL